MKRYIKEYAQDIQKEIDRRIAILNNPKMLTVISRQKTEEQSERLKKVLFCAEKQLITDWEAMKELSALDPRN